MKWRDSDWMHAHSLSFCVDLRFRWNWWRNLLEGHHRMFRDIGWLCPDLSFLPFVFPEIYLHITVLALILKCVISFAAFSSYKSTSLCILIKIKADSVGPGRTSLWHSQCLPSLVDETLWQGLSCSLMEPFLLCPQIPLKKNGSWKWLFCDWIHSVGINRPSRSPTPPILFLSRNVYGHCAGQSGLDNPNCAKFTSAHPHVLFPL